MLLLGICALNAESFDCWLLVVATSFDAVDALIVCGWGGLMLVVAL
jgi:CO dehydrogenase/acetyl-CoA synthase gamma subunit (corrinoid Fe-S protein)